MKREHFVTVNTINDLCQFYVFVQWKKLGVPGQIKLFIHFGLHVILRSSF